MIGQIAGKRGREFDAAMEAARSNLFPDCVNLKGGVVLGVCGFSTVYKPSKAGITIVGSWSCGPEVDAFYWASAMNNEEFSRLRIDLMDVDHMLSEDLSVRDYVGVFTTSNKTKTKEICRLRLVRSFTPIGCETIETNKLIVTGSGKNILGDFSVNGVVDFDPVYNLFKFVGTKTYLCGSIVGSKHIRFVSWHGNGNGSGNGSGNGNKMLCEDETRPDPPTRIEVNVVASKESSVVVVSFCTSDPRMDMDAWSCSFTGQYFNEKTFSSRPSGVWNVPVRLLKSVKINGLIYYRTTFPFPVRAKVAKLGLSFTKSGRSPSLVSYSHAFDTSDTTTSCCVICADELSCSHDTDGLRLSGPLGCSHVFHEGCITQWAGRRAVCPLCSTPITTILTLSKRCPTSSISLPPLPLPLVTAIN